MNYQHQIRKSGSRKQIFNISNINIFLIKRCLYFLAIGIFLVSCQSEASKANSDRKNEMALEQEVAEILHANDELRMAEQTHFRYMTELKIKRNDTAIAELKAKIKTLNRNLNSVSAATIVALEQKNNELKIRKEAYEQSMQNWNQFKSDYNDDLDELRNNLTEISGTKSR